MSHRRISRLLVAAGLCVGGFVTVLTVGAPPAGAGAIDPVTIRWCSTVGAPCVESAAHDGTPFTSSDTTYGVNFPWYDGNDATGVDNSDDRFFQVIKDNGLGFGYDLGTAEIGHIFTITLNLGSMVPRAVWGWADPAANAVTRSPVGGGNWNLTLNLKPVHRLSSCLLPPPDFILTCPHTAAPDNEVHAQIYGDVNDASWWGDTADMHDQLMGLNSFTNVDYTYEQPDITIDPVTGAATMTIPMANAHEDAAHNTFLGFQKIRLPNRMLRDVYGIPAPETMTPDSLASSVSGGVGTVHTYQEAGDDAMHVDVSDVTFSLHRLKVKRGTIVPTRPTNVRARRTADHRARIAFTGSSPRGARVSGYEVHCTTSGGGVGVATTTPSTVVVVPGLTKGAPYTCQVRARSKAGPSRWSDKVLVRRSPS